MYSQKMPNGVLKQKPGELSTHEEGMNTKVNPNGLVAGEDSKGFTAFTPNGVSRISLDTLVHKDNYGPLEDGDHYRGVPFSEGPRPPRMPRGR